MKNKSETTIFISYAWGGGAEKKGMDKRSYRQQSELGI